MPARLFRWIGITTAILAGLAGCSKKDDEAKKSVSTTPVANQKDNLGKPIQALTVVRSRELTLLPSFKNAVILDPPPEHELQPADRTYTGKNAVKIFESIANELWDKVAFMDNEGKRIKYQAVMKTELGDIHFDLHGDSAPNHVRNFVCLARSGYYDGMSFYYTINRKIEDNTISYIEAGCPRGTGEYGSGSIGYWLKPEISDKLTHEEGVLGACLGRDPESAACRFYVTAAAMPQMDGSFTIFGKVTKGLDVVRRINTREVQEFDRLKQPVLIRTVTIQTSAE